MFTLRFDGTRGLPLNVFATDQFYYASKIQLADPLIYVHEALGAALASDSVVFKSNWGPSTIASDMTFVPLAYVDVFGHAGSRRRFSISSIRSTF